MVMPDRGSRPTPGVPPSHPDLVSFPSLAIEAARSVLVPEPLHRVVTKHAGLLFRLTNNFPLFVFGPLFMSDSPSKFGRLVS